MTSASQWIPPHNLEAERAVLGAILLEPRNLVQAMKVLSPADFFKEGHRRIFSTIQSLAERSVSIDLLTLAEELRRTGALDEVGGPAALAGLVEEAVMAAHFPAYAGIVREKAARRELIRIGAEITDAAHKAQEPPRALLQQAIDRLNSFLSPKGEVGNESNFRPTKAADLVAEGAERIAWVWEPFLPEGGLALLVAFMKLGKSTFAYALAVAVAQGRPFLGFPTKQEGVLILAVEEHPRDVRRRLRRFGIRSEDPVYVHAGRLDNSPAALKEIQDFITKNRVTLVILDTLARYWNITDENDNAQVVRSVSPFLDLARETGAAVTLVHHERKTGGEQGRSIRGASALVGLVDQALLLDHRQGGKAHHRVLRTIGRYDETPRELIIALVGDEYHKLGTPEELELEASKGKVWEALSEAPRTVDALAKEAGLTEKMTRKAISALGPVVIREGCGKKNDPYTYRRGDPDSIRSQPYPIVEETKFSSEKAGVKSARVGVEDQPDALEEDWP